MKKIKTKERFCIRCTYHGCDLKATGGIPYLAPYFDPLILLVNIQVRDNFGHWNLFSNHARVFYGKQFTRLGKLEYGDVIELTAQLRDNGSFTYPSHVHLLSGTQCRETIPDNKKELIGYVMTQNPLYHLGGKYEYPFYIEKYEEWKKKSPVADQSKTRLNTTTTIVSNCHSHYGTGLAKKKGEN